MSSRLSGFRPRRAARGDRFRGEARERHLGRLEETSDGQVRANEERQTPFWFALKLGPTTFAIFDAFEDEAGREAHLKGKIAAALMAKASELLAQPPRIEKVEVLAAKGPNRPSAA